MLSVEDNDILTQTGPGTPMGELMREYWVPIALSSEFPVAGGDQVRILVLSERLIAFRSPDGQMGLIREACPHRGASLFYGRNEPDGIRCVYHGWKFGTDGGCIDMPSEPANSNFKRKIRATTYPVQERIGIVWAYLGSRETPPPMPNFEAFDVHADDEPDEMIASAVMRDCNWLQGMEGDLDTSHFGFLHVGHAQTSDAPDGTFLQYAIADRAPRYKIVERDFGATYGAYRQADDPDHLYWRIAHFLFPFYAMIPTGALGQKVGVRAWVPMDDEHMMMFNIGADTAYRPDPEQEVGMWVFEDDRLLPNTTDWYGRFRLEKHQGNDYLIDRDLQRSGRSFTGIPSIHTEDQAITESMGPIYDRTKEHLGTSDVMVIRMRRLLIAAARARHEDGTVPPGVDQPDAYQERSGGVVLGKDKDWLAATAYLREPGELRYEMDIQMTGGA
jgi:phthalate 4,5-dioxygenase